MDSQTPSVSPEWKESCRKAIIPKVQRYMRGSNTVLFSKFNLLYVCIYNYLAPRLIL